MTNVDNYQLTQKPYREMLWVDSFGAADDDDDGLMIRENCGLKIDVAN